MLQESIEHGRDRAIGQSSMNKSFSTSSLCEVRIHSTTTGAQVIHPLIMNQKIIHEVHNGIELSVLHLYCFTPATLSEGWSWRNIVNMHNLSASGRVLGMRMREYSL